MRSTPSSHTVYIANVKGLSNVDAVTATGLHPRRALHTEKKGIACKEKGIACKEKCIAC